MALRLLRMPLRTIVNPAGVSDTDAHSSASASASASGSGSGSDRCPLRSGAASLNVCVPSSDPMKASRIALSALSIRLSRFGFGEPPLATGLGGAHVEGSAYCQYVTDATAVRACGSECLTGGITQLKRMKTSLLYGGGVT